MGRRPYHRAPLGGNRARIVLRAGCGGQSRGQVQPLSLAFSLQFVLGMDIFHLGYTETGHCLGELNPMLPPPQRLQWDIPERVRRPGRGRDSLGE